MRMGLRRQEVLESEMRSQHEAMMMGNFEAHDFIQIRRVRVKIRWVVFNFNLI